MLEGLGLQSGPVCQTPSAGQIYSKLQTSSSGPGSSGFYTVQSLVPWSSAGSGPVDSVFLDSHAVFIQTQHANKMT